MDDYNEKNGSGELNGFDSVNENNAGQGYTVTPEGGFYTRQRQDIIQDNAAAGQEPEPQAEPQPEPVQPEQPEAGQTQSEPQQPGTGYAQGGYQANGYNTQGAYAPNVSYTPNGSYGYGTYTPKPPKVKKPHRKYSAAVIIAAVLLSAVVGAVSGISAVMLTATKPETPISVSSGVSSNNVNINVDETVESVVEAVANKVTPSVIGIRTTTSVMSFFGGSSEATGEGSGVVYTQDGYIITNYHVIKDAVESSSSSKIEVFLDSKSTESYPATVVGYNISSDLAVIKINVTGLTPITVGTSDNLKVGQYVITVGNPGGLEFMGSVTYGVISGLNRVVSSNSSVSLIQTDAAINPGNSGGALVNTKGELVGINSSKIVSEEFEGMGFAIPVNTVVEKCRNIIEKENDPEPYIGITVSEKYTSEVLSYYGYPAGAVVLSVADASPAASVGIKKGDIITEFNGTAVTEYSMLGELLSECSPKQGVQVKLYRSGRYYTTTITVGSNNAQ